MIAEYTTLIYNTGSSEDIIIQNVPAEQQDSSNANTQVVMLQSIPMVQDGFDQTQVIHDLPHSNGRPVFLSSDFGGRLLLSGNYADPFVHFSSRWLAIKVCSHRKSLPYLRGREEEYCNNS